MGTQERKGETEEEKESEKENGIYIYIYIYRERERERENGLNGTQGTLYVPSSIYCIIISCFPLKLCSNWP